MRRTTTLLALALLAAGCTDDPSTETASIDDAPTSSSASSDGSTSEPPSTEPPPDEVTTTTASAAASTTLTPATTTAPPPPPQNGVVVELYVEDEDDFCGDWIPARVGDDLTCRQPDTLPPDPVAHGTAWSLPVVDAALVDDVGWHPPLAVLNWDTVSLVTVDDPLSAPTVTPWARLDAWADDIRAAADGSIVVSQHASAGDEAAWPWIDIAVYRPDGSPPSVLPDGQILFDVAVHDDVEVIVYEPDPTDEDVVPVRLAPLDDLDASTPAFGPAFSTDWVTTAVDVDSGWAAVLGYLGNDSVIELRRPDGSVLPLPEPIAEHGLDDLDSVPAVSVSPDGARVTWVEYPVDLFGTIGTFARIKSVELDTNRLIFDLPIENENVEPTVEPVWSIVDLGDHVVVNTVGFWANRWWPNPAMILSFAADEPEWSTLPVTGIATPVPYTLD